MSLPIKRLNTVCVLDAYSYLPLYYVEIYSGKWISDLWAHTQLNKFGSRGSPFWCHVQRGCDPFPIITPTIIASCGGRREEDPPSCSWWLMQVCSERAPGNVWCIIIAKCRAVWMHSATRNATRKTTQTTKMIKPKKWFNLEKVISQRWIYHLAQLLWEVTAVGRRIFKGWSMACVLVEWALNFSSKFFTWKKKDIWNTF